MAPSLAASEVAVNVSQVAIRILDLIGDILPHLLTIKDDGTLILNGNFTVADMARFLCSCNTEKAPAGVDEEVDAATPIPSTHESAPASSHATSEVAPTSTDSEAQTSGKLGTKAKTQTGKKKASSSKKQPGTPKPGVQTRITNQLPSDVKTALNQSIKTLKAGEFRRKLEDQIIDVIETTIATKELQKSNPNLTKIKTVRFSQATAKDLEEMGVKANAPGAEPIKLDDEKLEELLMGSKHVTLESFKDGWKVERLLLCGNLWPIIMFFGDQFEPRTRSVADDFEKAFYRILKGMPEPCQPTQGEGAVLFEVNINLSTRRQGSSSSSNDTDLVIFGRTGTHLIGRLDYLAIIADGDTEEELMLALKQAKNLAEIRDILNSMSGVEFLLCIIETKRLLATMGELETHRPQVIAQSLAVLQNTGRDHVPWCLTDGHKWIFGLTWAHEDQGGFRFDTATINWLTETKNIKRPEDLQSCSEPILKAIVGWATIGPMQLKQLMMGWRKAVRRKE
ncbi:hypothetical protein EST38_g5463 [Candolleomyces aberdarensis]|uniref:Uncharacterized protein n=1 Tax=Candolleomyces aberdarensis TaxID=2316362 RepID=A0A4V1Q403_9AGAR|nr:hypothetical protein EST38_g5463 [Candolleomyces aberdarensis]